MNINTINSTNPNFNGRILTKGRWPEGLKKSFLENPEVNKIAQEAKYDIIGKMSSMRAKRNDFKHYYGEPLFKLTLIAKKENPTFIDKVKAFIGLLPKVKITRNYHCESSMESIMSKRLKATRIKEKLDI